MLADYNPVAELDRITRLLSELNVGSNEADALEFIVGLNDKRRHEVVVIVRSADEAYERFLHRLNEFKNFFGRENIRRLNQWGADQHNVFPLAIEYDTINGQPRITFRHRWQECRLILGKALFGTNHAWVVTPFKKS